VLVSSGTHAGTLWQLQTTGTITLDTTALTFAQVSPPSSVQMNNVVLNASDFSGGNLNVGSSHKNKMLVISNGSTPVTITINSSVMQNNSVFGVYRLGSASVTLVAGSGVTINSPGSVLTIPRYTTAELQRRSATVWDQHNPLGTAAAFDADTDGTMAANSATRVPSQSAVVTYVAAAVSALRNGVSSAFDTLAEIATELAAKVTGPGSATDSAIALYDGTTGKLIKSSSYLITTAVQFLANTASKVLTTDQVWSAAGVVTLTDAATIAVDMSSFINAKVTLGGNRTLGQPSNAKVGQSGCIEIIQSTGSHTLAYHADWYFAGGTDPVLSTAAGARDLLFYQVMNDSKIFATLVKAVA
jgi:hypothetical protein